MMCTIRLHLVTIFAVLAVCLGADSVSRAAGQAASSPPLAAAVDESGYLDPARQEPLPARFARPLIEVHKEKRRLFLFEGDKLLRSYPIILGRNPVDDKVRQGDLRTPEGRFYICNKNPRSRYHLSLGLSYPNIAHAERGLRDRLIDERQYDAIVRSINQGAVPPWNTALGGEIFIHGDAEFWEWTYGCIALRNRDIEELFQVVAVGTEVVIRK